MSVIGKRILVLTLALMLLVAGLSACGGKKGPEITISGAWARPSPKMATSGAAYMIFQNKGGEDDALIGAKSDVSAVTEIHEMVIDDNNVMHMKPVEGQRLVIPAGEKVELKPGSYHIMLINLDHQLEEGEVVHLTLKFEKSGEMKVDAPVKMMDMGG
jgi:copper(I)-binding protein